jgi:hypothetical protein
MAKKMFEKIPKTSVRIWQPVIKKLNAKMEAACLRRDAYIRRVLEIEIERLDEDVSIPNSKQSHDFVLDRLDQFDRKPVSLVIPHELTARLNDICNRKLIVRDAFFNRLFVLLAAAPSDIDRLFFSDAEDDWRSEVWSEYRNDGPFFQNGFSPLDPIVDPFWGIRCGLEILAERDTLEDYLVPATGQSIRIRRGIADEPEPERSLYSTVFEVNTSRGRDLLGLSCYLPDSRVPEHPAAKKRMAAIDALLAEM